MSQINALKAEIIGEINEIKKSVPLKTFSLEPFMNLVIWSDL